MSDISPLPRLWLLRHGETEWSRAGNYTGLTDLPLTLEGEEQAVQAGAVLASTAFDMVLTSPLQRARRTAELAGFDGAVVVPDAHEWDYGDYEGVKSADIRARNPEYLIWTHGVPNGETLASVAGRADRIIADVRARLAGGGNALLVSHGHFSRIVAARWLGLPPDQGAHFLLGTAKVCTLGWDKRTPAIEAWNL